MRNSTRAGDIWKQMKWWGDVYAKGEPYSHRPAVTEAGKKILFGQTAAGPKAA